MSYTITNPNYTGICYNCGEPIYRMAITHPWFHKYNNGRDCPTTKQANPLPGTVKENVYQ